MKNTELNEAFLYVDDRYLDTVNFTDKEIIMTDNKKSRNMRKVIIAAAVAAVFALMGTVVYAANLWGIREMWHGELSEEAAEMIQIQDETYKAEDWSCKLTETLYDGNSITAAVKIFGGDKYILIPTDLSPDDPASFSGFDFDGTLAEYAEAQGKSLLNVSAHLSVGGNRVNGFMHFENIADNEMVILTSANINADRDKIDDSADNALCTVYANGQKIELPFSLKTGYMKEIGTFVPVNPTAIPGITVGTATVTKTELGIYISFPVTFSDEKHDIVLANCDTVTDFLSMSFSKGSDGVWYAEMNMGQGEVEDTLTVLFEDVMCNPIGEIVFEKE